VGLIGSTCTALPSAPAKWRWLRCPMQVPAMGQWWSSRPTHRRQVGSYGECTGFRVQV